MSSKLVLVNIILLDVLYALSFSSVNDYNNNCWKTSLFSTKTPYKLAVPIDGYSREQRPCGKCEPVHVNMVHRHGNRYPSAKDVRNMLSMAEKINLATGRISPTRNLSLPWKCPFTVDQDKLLSTVGETELYEIGKNLKNDFPEIFRKAYSPLLYKFQSTCKLRCTHSSNALASGIFEDHGTLGKHKMQPIAIKTNACDNDPVLRFFDLCEKYIVDVNENKSVLHEMRKFDMGSEMQKVTEKVLGRLGAKEIDLSAKDLKALLIACAYDLGMFNGNSGICSLLDEEDISVLEYSLDLKHFYKRSAAYKITYESSCPLLSDILVTLQSSRANSSDAYVGVFRSAHAETLIPLLAILGLYSDKEYPTASNYQNMKERRFRGACLSPFSGNIYFVLYRCENNDYKIQMFVNEQLTKIPCCDSALDCSYDNFLNCYGKYINDCHLEKMCKLPHAEL